MKRVTAIILLTLAALIALSPVALADSARVYDQAQLFSEGEKSAISDAIASFQKDTGMDFVVVTSKTPHDDASQQQIADNFYLKGGFGLDDEKSGVLYYIDMYERWHYITTAGVMQDYMTDSRIQSAIETCKTYLSRGDYAAAVEKMLNLVRGYIDAGIPEGQFRYDVITGQRLTARHKVLQTGEIAISAGIAFVVALVFALIVRSRYKLKGNTYEYDYRNNSSVDITDTVDDYLRTTTTRTRKADPPSGGGGGGGFGGGGGGSGVHNTGGTSFGGGGGKF